MHVPAAEIFMETSNISGFTLIIPILSPAATRDLQYIFFGFLLLFYAILGEETRIESFVPWGFASL